MSSRSPSTPGVLRGAPKVLKALINHLASLAPPDSNEREIILTWQGERDIFETAPELEEDWWRSLRHCLDQGWDLTQLVRLKPEPSRTLPLVADMLRLLGARGAYSVRRFSPLGSPTPPSDFLTIPGRLAVQFFATEQSGYVDAAIFLDDPEQVAVLTTHCQRLAAQTTPLLEAFLPGTLRPYEVITEVEEELGNRLLVQQELSALTRPDSWLHRDSRWARTHQERGLDAQKLIDLYRRRRRAMEVQVQRYHFRDTCSQTAIERLSKAGEYARNGENLSEQREHLKQVIWVLETYRNYEIALADSTEEKLVSTAFWAVKAGQAVLMEIPGPIIDDRPAWTLLKLVDPLVTDAFRQYFLDRWGKIGLKDKGALIPWLRQRIALFPER